MTQIKTSKGEYIIFEVCKDAINFFIEEYQNNTCSLFYISNNIPNWSDVIKGNYTFICTTDTITEDIAKGMVDRDRRSWWTNYLDKENAGFIEPINSFNSLLQSHNLDTNKTYAICKKIN